VLPSFTLGAAGNYALLYEGTGGHTFHYTNSFSNTTGSGFSQGGGIGNVGIGGTGQVSLSGPGTMTGNLDLSAANTGQVTGGGITITGATNYSVSAVTSALNTVNALNTTLGALPGTNVTISGNTTINAINGTFSASGSGYTNVRVFNVTSFSLNNGQAITINGDANGDSVVLNFTSNTNFHGDVILTGGLTPDNVIFNFVGNVSLDLNDGNPSSNAIRGIFLDPNGTISTSKSNVLGRVFGGDSSDFQWVQSNITAPVATVTPTLTTTPNPTAVTLGSTAVTLTDSATLSGGNSPTGTITFTLFYNGGSTAVDTETVTVSGNATYTTPNGFKLPTSGTVTGTYQWDASYSGDPNNNPVSDDNNPNEKVTVSAASPTLSTAPNPTTVTLGATAPPVLTDTATLSGGYNPTGTITFTLFFNGGSTAVDTETVTVSGNGTYKTPTGFTLPTTSTVTGTYQWDAKYSGDGNNNTVSDSNNPAERVTVSAATPTLSTTPSPTTVTLGATTPPILTDSAVLSGGYHPTGTITFTLFYNGGTTPVDTETVTVSGNGTYTTPTGFKLPTTGTVTGTYQWDASFSGDGNNNTVSDSNNPAEKVTVSAASPTLTTTPSPTTVTLGATTPPILTDSSVLSGGYHPTGTITFTLFHQGTLVDTETATVNGNGTYTTPTGFTLPSTGTVTGTYQWDASFSGDSNNGTASDNNNVNEQVTVSAASPAISTTPSPATGLIGVTLQDSAALSGGYRPTGSITFTLFAPGVNPSVGPATYTEIVSGVNGNGTYNTSQGFAANAVGTWHWVATYNGDANNSSATSGPTDEPVTVSPQADLALTKTVNDVTPNVGQTVTFTVTLTNNGPSTATGVQVTDLLPAGLTFVSSTPSQGTYVNTTGIWTVGTVAVAAAPTLQIQATVASPNAQTNTATITAADQFDPNPNNNQASITVTPQQADLALAKTVDHATPNVGDTVTFTITLTNNGPWTATNVQVTDQLPSGLTFVSATPSQGTYSNTSGVWTVGTVAVAAAPTLQIQATVVSPNAETNTASISHADQFDPDPGNNSAAATVTPQQADLVVGKQVSDPTPNVGEIVTYTVTVGNNGPNTATTVALQDVLPTEVMYESSSATEGSYNPSTSTWTVGTVAVGATQTLTITVKVVSPNPASNTASISHSDQFDPDTANNSDMASIVPQQADLELMKTVNDSTPNVGETVTFTVTLTNNGPSAATNVQVTDQLPSGLTFVSATPSQGTYVSSTGLWTVGTVAMATMPTLQIRATVASANAEINTATITAADQFDPDPGNNTASVTVTPQQADLAVTKMVNDATPNVGDTVTFTVALNNLGPDPATNVQLTDLLPAGLTFVSSTPSQGTYTSTTGVWTVGTVDLSTAQTLVLTAMVASPNATTNTASITASDQFDPNKGNNTASVTVTPQQADLALTKAVNDATPNVGQTINFTITLRNNGPDTATGVQVTDLLPAGLTFVSATPSQGSYSSVTGVWTVGTVNLSTVPTLAVSALVVSPNPETNTASITHADQFDPDTGNNTASATETPQEADLGLTKTVDDATPNVGQNVTFTVTLTNFGPNTANGVTVQDSLPAGLVLVSATPSQGSYQPNSGNWNVGTVNVSGTETLVLVATVTGPNTQTNMAKISHSAQFDPNPANDQASVTVTPQEADLALTKTVNDATPNVGNTVTFTVTMINKGPDAATNVQVTDLLPAGLTFVSAKPSQGTYVSSTGVWTVGTVAVASAPTLQIQATVASPNAETNTATITAADQFDPDTGNNTSSVTVTPQQADLAVGKRVSNPTPNVGDTITYTVTVSNNGPDTATGVTLQDVLPAGVSYQSSSATEGSYNPNTSTWTVGTVAVGATQTLTITVLVVSPNPASNTASISHADQFDPDTSNNSDTASTTPQQADLELTKTVNDPTPNVGGTVTFTVTLTNNGPATATGVQVTDQLPAGLTFVSATPSQGSYVSSTGLWTVGTVALAGMPTLQIHATVASPNAQINTATISAADQFDPDPGNNTASVTVTPQQADLALTKTVNDARPNVGDSVTFTVTLSNHGPNAATNVSVADALPAGLTFVSATPSQGTYSNTTGVWTVGTVAVGTPQTLTIMATVASPNAETNTATISHSDQFDPNSTNNQASVTVTPQQADLALTKTVNDATPNVGETVIFTVTLSNKGPDAATNVSVSDALPAGLTFVSATPGQGSYSNTTGVWTVGTVVSGTPETLTISATVASPSAETNTATISHSDQFDPDTGNNTASATVTPQQADLVVGKQVSDPTPNVGEIITYTVTVANDGPDTATGVALQDVLPAGVSYQSSSATEGSYDPNTRSWTVGTVAVGATQTLTITALVVSPNPATNTASVSAADQFDPNTANNSDTASIVPQQADLELTKTVNDATPNVGDTVIFTVRLTNNGPSAATNVQVTDLLPSGLTFVSATPSQGTYVSSTGLWTVGTVAMAAMPTLQIQATVVSPSAETNTATISASDQFDPDPGNNTASVTVTPQQADLALTKTVNDATPNVGDTVTFTVTLSNLGPDPATGVSVADAVPSGLTLVNAIPSQGTYAGGVWTVGAVSPSAAQTLIITALVVSPSAEANTASISHADQFDPNTGNNTASITVTPQQADLALTKTVNDATPNVGNAVIFTVTLTNNGPDAATNVSVADALPAGLTLVSAAPSQGTYAGGVWTVGTVSPSSAPTLTLTALVVSPQAETNTATISAADQFDPNTANNTASATVTPQQADLALTKTVNDATPNVGDTIIFTVTLTNNGPDTATNVSVADALPAGLTFVSATPSQGTYSSTTGVWTLGTVALAAAPTLQIQATVASPNAETNTATISHADQFDPIPGNNSATVTVTPQQADLAVGKQVSNPTPNVGQTITYTITVANNGPDTATGVTLQDVLPAGVSYQSSSATEGSYDLATSTWTVGTVAVGATQTLTITVLVVSPNPASNTASISHSDQFDPNTANNSDTASTSPQQADLELTKTVNDSTPNVGGTVTFTVTLTNNGPATATGVEVTDLLPAGLTFVSAAPSQGSYSNTTGVWIVGTVAVATTPTLQIQATVASPNAQINTTTITAADQFDPDPGNNTASVTVTPQQADLALTKTVNDATPNVGDTVTFTVALSNHGPDPATNVSVADALPAGLTFVSATPSQGSYSNTTGVWTVGTVAVGTQTLTIMATVVSPSAATNTASISHTDQFDPDPGNNTASVTVTPQQADLALTKTVNDATPNVGDTVTFTVTLSNNGPDAATNVSVSDALPAGLTFVSAMPSQGSYSSTTGVWTVGTVNPLTFPTLTLAALVVSPNTETNTASISHADQFDPDPGNNTASATVTPQQADLVVGKQVSDPTPNVGETITYTVTVANDGPDAATGVALQDVLPAGVMYQSSSASEGRYDPATRNWTVGTVAVSATQTLTITALVVSPNPASNTASISHAEQFDPDTSNNTDTASIVPQQADLELTKTVNNATPNVGDTVTFTVTLTNNGPSAATNVRVTDLLPSGLTFGSATPSQGTYVSSTGLWTVGTVAMAAMPTLQIEATVASANAETNTTTISASDQFDPDPGNNTVSVTVTPQQADLALTKTVNDATPNVGDTVTYTVTVSNLGPDPATNVSVSDLLPAGLTFVSATPSEGTYDSTSGVWTVGTVDLTAAQTLVITALVVSPNTETNTASISHADQFDPNTGNNTANVTVTPQQADLALTKTVSNATANVGDTVIFTVTLTNNGPDAATGVEVTDLLPAGLTFLSATPSQGSYISSTGLWTVGTVAMAATPTLQIQATVASPNAQTNTATISHSDQFDPDSGNNQASVTVTPQQADLALTKTVNDATPNVGDTVTFTVTLTNNGPDAATSVSVADVLPVGLTFVSATPSQGSYTSTTGIWNVGTVAVGTPETLTITATVSSPNAETNTATISHADQFDPDTGNNTASVTVTPQQADLAVGKQVSDPTPNVGETITYTITVANNGPDTATGVTLQDVLPAGVSYQSSSATEGSYDLATSTWTVGTVAVGTPQTLSITVLVVSPNPASNTASISHSDQFDPDTSNNSDTASINPQQADLELTKTVNDPTPNVGETVTFTVTLTNNGPATASGVQVTDQLPAGLIFVSATPSQGSFISSTGLWTVGTVAMAATPTLEIQATVDSPSAETNTASISHSDQFDPDTGNNTASTTVTPQQADLALSKMVNDATPNVGDTVTFTVALNNHGPDDATNVSVADALPAGLTFVSAAPSEGNYDSTTGVWTVGPVAVGTPQTLTITARVTSPSAETNTATISHADQFDPNTGNNQASVTVTPQQADLAMTKTVNDATPNVGDTVTFTVTLSNHGPDTATGVQVTDQLPAGLTFVSATPSQGSYSSTTGVWTVGTVAFASTPTLQIQATVTSPSAETNTATISHADQFDPDTGNNTASVTVTSRQADLVVGKQVSNPTPNVGQTITYTVTVANDGPDTATGVTLQDVLPAGVSYQSSSATEGSYDLATSTWTVGTVAVGATETLTITVQVVSPSPASNTASISHSDQFDPDTSNNSDTASINPQQADLELTKTVNDATPNVGDTVTFTVTLTNNGPATATNVLVTDQLPSGLTFVSATPSQGTYVNSTGLWTVGTVAMAATPTLQIQATVTGSNAATNTATIIHSDQFDPDPGNNTVSITVTPQQADLALTKTVNDTTPNVGDKVTFTVTLSNLGPDPATNVSVSDALPAGLKFVSATPSQGSYSSATGVWTVGTVSPSAAQTLVITAMVVSPSAETNTASISHADQFDPNSDNNTVSVTVTPQQADLALTKTVNDATPNVGDKVIFTISLRNLGPDAATNVSVADALPAGLTFVSAIPSLGSYSSATGVWTVGTVSTAVAPTLTLTALVASPSAETNTASISHVDQFDPNTSNNTAKVTVTPQQADLALTKTVNDATPNVGDTVTFTVTLTNNGPDAATNVSVADALPVGLTFVSATPSQGSYRSTTGVWTAGTLAVTAAPTLQIQATVVSLRAQTNTASISHADQFDPNTANNTASVTVTPGEADLALAKTVNDPRPYVGKTITFTVTLTNLGPDTATNVTIHDSLPAGLQFVTSSVSQGSYVPATGIWTVGPVGTTTPETLIIFAKVLSLAPATNVATVSHSDQFDPDFSNNTASATVTPEEADLSITKTPSSTQVVMGQNVIFTVTVHNNGPSTATNVITSDPLPQGLFFIGVGAISQGSVNAAGTIWSIGTLSAGATAKVQLILQVIAMGPVVNTASVRADQFDPDLSNNQASAQVVGTVPPPLFSKASLIASVDPSAFDGTNQRFIAHLYRDLLHREADVDGLASWSLELAEGVTRSQIALAIENSPEYCADEVEGIYGRFLHRSAAPAEVNGWVNLLLHGTTVEQMEAFVAGSPEYYQFRAGSSTTGFLDALYGDALGRAIDPTGVAGWSEAIAGGASRESVAAAVLFSSEGNQDWIQSTYEKYLHRAPDPTGLSSWSGYLARGADEEQALALILGSEEYFNQH
jgi:uncharacterized repeat protein (TIGR01451 family)